jgi:hypothetical protein
LNRRCPPPVSDAKRQDRVEEQLKRFKL